MVAVFPGAQMAWVLRPRGERGAGCFELVGETYCHGVIDGEVWMGGLVEDVFLV